MSLMYTDLPMLPGLMEQASNVCVARHVKLEDFLKLFDAEVHGKIRAACLNPGVTHVVCLENLDMWSSQFGARAALAVGVKPEGAQIPSWTIEKVLTTPYFRLGDVPSRFQYPVAYADVSAFRTEAAPQQRPAAAEAPRKIELE